MKYKWEKKQRNGRAFLLLRVNVYSFYFPKKTTDGEMHSWLM